MSAKIQKHKDKPLIHHFGRELQHCSKVYHRMPHTKNRTSGMPENGSPCDNVVAEKINGIFKDESRLAEHLDNYIGTSCKSKKTDLHITI